MTTQRKRKKRWWLWAIPAVVVVLLVIIVAVARGSGSKMDPSKLAKATRGDIAKSVVATGKIQPITKVELKSKASGIVEQLFVDINQHVHKGQVLAQLDQQEILAQVAAQKAQLAASEANVVTYKANIDQDKVAAAAPDLPMYKSTYERNLAMSNDGIVSRQTLDDAQRNYVAAENKRDSSVAQISVDQAKLKQAQAQVQQSQASLDQLNEQLSYTTLVSPMDGVVLSRDVEIGDAVSSILVLGSTATLVMTLGDTTQVYVQGKVDEADIGSVYLGQPAHIRVESFPNKSFNGKVTKIAPLGVEKDNVTTFEVRVSIDNPTGELKANMTANAEILITEHKNALSVPEQALVYDNQKNASVFVPDPKQKDGQRKIAVKSGISNGSRTEILDGLKEGDTVVLQQ
ncbi:efflux RND transporter periplasmic adaptor subunit [Alloacidobacterium dinghuense]|uniref:Efflux RND transporter periplasmic adaptor subunit n=1 Tax=Alloacidobacterium dinghuense TaxID=2763107 RepID=A0A7G8BMJ5_9BACT|nr:efflux RND transporter periplasmic adaptor subunit [Alloacidobacterium dinghuense]QNI33765.1 efflux RND transporter periplasmic adaptor subunit [Alloacidobacterium dinghuense]